MANSQEPIEPVAWREHVEQRLRSWRQSQMNRSGDRLALDDFMGEADIEDLIDWVCDEYAGPSASPDQSARIAALETALKVAREALEGWRSVDVHSALTEDEADAIKAKDDAALRAIEEVRRG